MIIEIKESVTKECRICSGTEDDGKLISPCLCSGSVQYIHMECLEKWQQTTSNYRYMLQCEMCKYKYKYSADTFLINCMKHPFTSLVIAVLFIFGLALLGSYVFNSAYWDSLVEISDIYFIIIRLLKFEVRLLVIIIKRMHYVIRDTTDIVFVVLCIRDLYLRLHTYQLMLLQKYGKQYLKIQECNKE